MQKKIKETWTILWPIKDIYIVKTTPTYLTDINGTLPMYTEPIIQSYMKTDAQKCYI